jgi:hypothetical protein
MNDEQREQFEALLVRSIGDISASPRRLRNMREEMLSHLVNSYEEELARLGDERAAEDAAIERLGDADELQAQLQASVPFLKACSFCAWIERRILF